MDGYTTIRVSAGDMDGTSWTSVERYLYATPLVAWDTRYGKPRVFDDEVLGAAFEIAVEQHWFDAGQGDRLASGLIGWHVKEGS